MAQRGKIEYVIFDMDGLLSALPGLLEPKDAATLVC